jgi:aminopeptidase
MTDPRVDRLAQLLVSYSTRVKPGDRAFIETWPLGLPLAETLCRHILEAGGHPHLLLHYPEMEHMIVQYGDEEQLDFTPLLDLYAYQKFDVRIRIRAEANTKAMGGLPKSRVAQRGRAHQPILQAQMERGARGDLRWLTTLYPTEAYAQDAEMSLSEYEDFFYRACHVDSPDQDAAAYWKGMKAELSTISDFLKGKDHVELRGPNLDLSLSIKGRTFLPAEGLANMPDGEVFTGPVEQSINGWVRFTYPAIWRGNVVEAVELKFADGKVIEAHAAKNEKFLKAILETDAGSRYVGEFAFGTNFGIDRFTGQILLDEKIGGTIHLALGSGYPETGSVNKSAIHWDMICDMRSDSEVHVDGVLLYKDGQFQV